MLEKITGRLGAIAGVRAVVLGGSYARRTAGPNSDLDLGIYYFDESPFAIPEIRQLARELAVEPPAVTGFYEWGRWVNGGAWIHTGAGKVDFLYRSLDQVRATLSEASEGIVHHDYDQQPAYGFYSVIYLAETQYCFPLFDPDGLIAGLKRQVEVYPPKLKERIISDALWSTEFTLAHAHGFAAAGDVYSTAGCLTRAASNLVQALYALNEVFFSGDKKALDAAGKFKLLPAGFMEGLSEVLGRAGETPEELVRSVSSMEKLWRGVVALAGDAYRARYSI